MTIDAATAGVVPYKERALPGHLLPQEGSLFDPWHLPAHAGDQHVVLLRDGQLLGNCCPLCDGDIKLQAVEYGESEMRGWYRSLDLLPGGMERIVGAGSTLIEPVDRIMIDSNLAGLPAWEG